LVSVSHVPLPPPYFSTLCNLNDPTTLLKYSLVHNTDFGPFTPKHLNFTLGQHKKPKGKITPVYTSSLESLFIHVLNSIKEDENVCIPLTYLQPPILVPAPQMDDNQEKENEKELSLQL
jgi:hypothetical protein